MGPSFIAYQYASRNVNEALLMPYSRYYMVFFIWRVNFNLTVAFLKPNAYAKIQVLNLAVSSKSIIQNSVP